ncbi:hypothetical protein [Clostridium cellulovorans]|uniref:Uncharacterized protein n=1 Tax=Clostridium cellulovorans (strain ATCC 35296 / DSM 3052 / OCM 3 / 743B) TaxID=573061 RepID=D9SV24_CLOC7|nr:hypothetical protein [Clostridium cellulovorans]ADL52999.1 hypothetical protein Clocel_3319 [Clostridium cellulovorans 743B]
MKKYAILIVLSCLLYTMINTMDTYASNVFKEGVYKAADFNFSSGSLYRVQNISNKNASIFVFDENQAEIQYIRLNPGSRSYNLVPLRSSYRIAIIGNGEIFISS